MLTQVFLTGVYALFLFNGTRLADSVVSMHTHVASSPRYPAFTSLTQILQMSCDSSMLGLVQRALNSCGPKVGAALASLRCSLVIEMLCLRFIYTMHDRLLWRPFWLHYWLPRHSLGLSPASALC